MSSTVVEYYLGKLKLNLAKLSGVMNEHFGSSGQTRENFPVALVHSAAVNQLRLKMCTQLSVSIGWTVGQSAELLTCYHSLCEYICLLVKRSSLSTYPLEMKSLSAVNG